MSHRFCRAETGANEQFLISIYHRESPAIKKHFPVAHHKWQMIGWCIKYYLLKFAS